MKQYDYIIAGAGCAGLSLAYHLSLSGWKGKKVLIVDRAAKLGNDRTWCFWSSSPHALAPVVSASWPTLAFADDEGVFQQPIAPFSYQMIRSADFYRFVRKRLAEDGRFEFLEAPIERLQEDEQGPFLQTPHERYRADYIFNSALIPAAPANKEGDYNLLQHFKGWWIETAEDTFDTDVARLMDFRTDQQNDVRFFYLLPINKREALVEYTLFSKRTLDDLQYQQALERYLTEVEGISQFQVKEQEFGVIPMSNRAFTGRQSKHIIHIGTPSGMVKPTTGYAFQRIQQQAQVIVAGIETNEYPSPWQIEHERFRFYDNLLLHILSTEGGKGKSIFSALFRRTPFRLILRFLGEQTRIWEDVRILGVLPYAPFLKALAIRCLNTLKQKRIFLSGSLLKRSKI